MIGHIAHHRCLLTQFRCKDFPVCIPLFKKCDGDDDCPDKSDEPISCVKNRTCDKNEFKCSNGRSCVLLTQRCDQKNDCGDGSDETKCGKL